MCKIDLTKFNTHSRFVTQKTREERSFLYLIKDQENPPANITNDKN